MLEKTREEERTRRGPTMITDAEPAPAPPWSPPAPAEPPAPGSGLMPITRSASSSSRMVRAPRSAHIAVAPAPATTNTVTIGPIWFTVPIAAPVPEKSAAPNSFSRTLKVKTSNHRLGHRHHQRGQHRHPRHEPALNDVFPPRKRRPDHQHEGVQRHREEAADRAHGLAGRRPPSPCAVVHRLIRCCLDKWSCS